MNISILLERTLPLSKDILDRIASGELKVFGGTIRDQAGRIVKHLIFPQGGQNNQSNNLDKLSQQINTTLNQSHTEIMGQLANQTAILAAVNIMTAHSTNETLGKKLEEISDKIDHLDKKLAEVHDEIILSKLIKFSEIKSLSFASIDEALYANKVQKDPQFIRLHIIPLRNTFNSLHTILMDMLSEFSNKKFIDGIHFLMLITDLKNKTSFVLGQTHIRLGEDDIAQGYFDRNTDSNLALRSRLESLKKTGAFSPHVISEETLLILKTDVENFKTLEIQSQLLSIQNKLSLELKLPHYELLNNSFDTIQMLDPIPMER
ncbi:hypothetical protein EKN56_01965 [Limnobaculum zhutongyuii]|uniref:Uncharacterized protein n=1 Tax=Limnobaculum zhutongyuii TaxID=2498113 RepID=A0A411WH23_9GAMM|nr:hypothetical protein [Limnobaculum zhutongyuii]QBH95277.1 hypothetical protein EKN56_01965 [Limnobaculum zhutongyuii]TQS89105.1 hypothetical protein ELQ32_07935 [Limnobaculum zhutongyuii]